MKKQAALSDAFIQKLLSIRLVIFDIDGVMTDGKIWLSPTGDEYKVFNVQDGYGIQQLQKHGFTVAVISGRDSSAVAIRLRQLGIRHYFLGREDKRAPYDSLLASLALTHQQVAYVGDDLPDLPIMKLVGVRFTVANAVPPILAIADWCSTKRGGDGAVREICDFLLSVHNAEI